MMESCHRTLTFVIPTGAKRSGGSLRAPDAFPKRSRRDEAAPVNPAGATL